MTHNGKPRPTQGQKTVCGHARRRHERQTSTTPRTKSNSPGRDAGVYQHPPLQKPSARTARIQKLKTGNDSVLPPMYEQNFLFYLHLFHILYATTRNTSFTPVHGHMTGMEASFMTTTTRKGWERVVPERISGRTATPL